ncbi:sodium/potassium/calcium exchanger 4-like [Bicyclus anynana]|uniref:Sodium/potassium/calcium exchanger 4-like n=1 Tax=Bicyclus anynana TaxID=110368 RepID=A0ABM3M653_BICAN|nr:sodium/potassium/calcium exchanger 4-like [Bicyclus anynana]
MFWTMNRRWNRFKIAFCIRIMFFGVPLMFFITNNFSATTNDYSGQETVRFSSRHLLGLIDQEDKNCSPAAILEFPSDGLNKTQRQNGYILIHCVLAIYCFLLLGIICEEYFVPAIEILSERLKMPADIVGATFMATASSSTELFINCVGTFITEGDLGVGAILGSAVFNILAVPALCTLIAGKVIILDWWSISRDCMMYAVAVVALILTLLDSKVYWYEALLLILAYIWYIVAMVYDGLLSKMAKTCCIFGDSSEAAPLLYDVNGNDTAQSPQRTYWEQKININERGKHESSESGDYDYLSLSQPNPIWSWPNKTTSIFQKLYWLVSWPIRIMLWCTIPDCKKYYRIYPVSLMMCIMWIAGVSYLVAWIITIIGDTLDIPDSITGLIIVAAGASIPEAVSSVLVTIKGHGTMGVSNTIGSNTFDILLCLGLPWFVKSAFFPSDPNNHWVAINSNGLSYSAIFILSTLMAFYISLYLNKFQLDWKVAIAFLFIYASFNAMAAIIELNMFFPVNLPICPH